MGEVGSTYAVYLRLIGKFVVDFLLVIIELFSPVLVAQPLYDGISIDNHCFCSDKVSFPQELEGDVPHQPFFVSEN